MNTDRVNALLRETTVNYYASWLGVCPHQLSQPGIQCVYSLEREKTQIGYNQPYALYLYITDKTIVISYGEKASVHRDWIYDYFSSSKDLTQLKTLLYDKIAISPRHDIKYLFTGNIPEAPNTHIRQLNINNYPEYLTFFLKDNPESGTTDWLYDYFNDIVAKGYIFGVYEDNQLVCATDAPSMPYLQDKVVEIGISTLNEFRNRGYAAQSVCAMLQYLILNGKTPIYSCASTNIASQMLAQKTGFTKLADVISISL